MKRIWFAAILPALILLAGCRAGEKATAPECSSAVSIVLELPENAETSRAVAETLKEHWRLDFKIVEVAALREERIVVGEAQAESVQSDGSIADLAIPEGCELSFSLLHFGRWLVSALPDAGDLRTLEWSMIGPEWSGLPVPLDALFISLKPRLLNSKCWSGVSVALPEGEWWSRATDLWNVYAWLKCFSTGDFDPAAERTAYLQENFGPAEAPMREYFRLGERTYMAAAALAGIGRPGKLDPVDVFLPPVLAQLQSALDRAYELTIAGTEFRANVEQELWNFTAARQRLEATAETRVRHLRLGTAAQPLVTRNGDAAEVTSSVAMRADADNLYLIFQADEPRMEGVRMEHAGRDEDGMWDDDGFEIFLMPDPDRPQDGYQFIVNAKGAVWDGKRTLSQSDVGWSAAGAQGEVVNAATGWQLTVTLPWRDLGCDGIPETPWRANFYRNRMAEGEREAYAWSPVLGTSYYQPEHFGWLHWNEK